MIRIGQVTVDFDTHQINGPDGNQSVEPKIMDVLQVLVDNSGQVVTREDLIDQVWGVGHGGDERLSRAIYLLRKSLGDSRGEHAYIQTISGKGYKLTADVEPVTPAEPSVNLETEATTDQTLLETKPPARNRRIIGLVTLVIAALGVFYIGRDILFPPASEPPLVMIMDSAHPSRVYDEALRDSGGTNADILSDILADLPIRTQKELIYPTWHRYESMTQFEPDLIVIHYSGFKQEDASGDRPQLRLLVEYFLKTDTEFLVYSRASQNWLDDKMNTVLAKQYEQDPKLKDRIYIFPLLEYGEPSWMDPTTSQGVKLKVKEILAIK